MELINTLSKLKDYQKQIDRHREIVLISPIFLPHEKQIITDIYSSLMAITEIMIVRKTSNIEVANPTFLS